MRAERQGAPRVFSQANRLPNGAALSSMSSLGLALLAISLPVLLHLAAWEIAIGVCMALAFLIANYAASSVFIVLIFAYLFQNLFIALISPAIENMEQFNAARGYNFILTVVIWVTLVANYWLARRTFEQRFQVLMDVTTGALVLIGIYFVIGLFSNPAGAIVYLRNIAAPYLLFQILALVAYKNQLSVMGAVLTIACFAVAYGYLEFAAHDSLMRLINGDAYLGWRTKQEQESGAWVKQMQETGVVLRSYLDTMLVDFLNTPLFSGMGLQFYRVVGPNFHFISFAYAVAFFIVVLAAARRIWFVILAFPLLIIIGSKGALLLATFVVAAIIATRFVAQSLVIWGFAILLLGYAIVGVAVGILVQDYHVIGFIGGVRGFVSNPFGRGIGVGGNLSMDMTTIDWSKYQQLGHTDIAVESAVGVLLYQMGIFGLVVLAILVWLAIKLWQIYRQRDDLLSAVGALALLTVMVNGIFQEEALFSPLALGIVLGLVGLLLGRAYRRMAPRSSSLVLSSHSAPIS
jgi:hypothetical protein